ncbi:MAG: rod shape-determining protein RodA [Eubacterium sp.]|nr:rod shape-determining protein RodA [Eubacterium sp.]
MLRQKYQFKNYNWLLVIVVFIVSGMGVVFINSADPSYTIRQFIGLMFCGGLMLLLSVVNYNFICDFSRILYLVNIVILVFVKLFGVKVGGARRWINLGVTRIQPSELSKIIMIIFVAMYIQDHEEDFTEPKVLLRLAGLCAVPLLLVVAEPDLSTTIDITMILLAVIFAGGISTRFIKRALLILIPVGVLFVWYIQTPGQILLKDYQVTRIMTFLEPSKYQDTTAYQQQNSVMAIGSGQLYGKGLNNNTISDVTVTDTGLVSEQQTDFIFSVIGEEIGFIGSVVIIGLLAVIVILCLITAWRARNISGRLIAVGIAALIGFQSFINIGVATQLLPNTGLPLPFISYGLTSLLSCMMGIGMVLNIGLQRHY